MSEIPEEAIELAEDEQDQLVWLEFQRLMKEEKLMVFLPRNRDVRIGSFVGVIPSVAIFLRCVLAPLPKDALFGVCKLAKLFLVGLSGLALGTLSLVIGPILGALRFAALAVYAVSGRLYVSPNNESLADLLNHRLRVVRGKLQNAGHNVDSFYEEIDASQITEDVRQHLLRDWKP